MQGAMSGLLSECREGQDVHSGYAAAHFLDVCVWGKGGALCLPRGLLLSTHTCDHNPSSC